MRPGWGGALLLSAALLVPPPAQPASRDAAADPRPLGGVEALARVYDHILNARFDEVDPELRRACPPGPPVACDVLGATALWWRIMLDPDSRALDQDFAIAVDRAIRGSEAWVARESRNAEAWFYLGGAYGARVQWRVLRNEKLSAARDGKRIKQSLERAIALDPGLDDAFFGVGLYKYYADVAPTAARFLRFLLLLPGGDRKEGLAQMLRARNQGRLLRGEADYQLHIIYLWYEHQTDEALELLRSLQARYPENPLFLTQIALIQDTYQHDVAGSLETWRHLLAMARDAGVNASELAEVQARLGAARQLEALALTDDAIDQLQGVIALKPQAPYSSLALAYLRLGEAQDRLGARTAALAAYRSALAALPPLDVMGIRAGVTERQQHAPDARHADAYRLSLYGWRRLEEGDALDASGALERSLELNGDDPVARYRYARALAARKAESAALAQFDLAIRGYRNCPAPILASAYLEAARLRERAGHRADAITYYRSAANLFGASRDTRTAATRALARLSRHPE